MPRISNCSSLSEREVNTVLGPSSLRWVEVLARTQDSASTLVSTFSWRSGSACLLHSTYWLQLCISLFSPFCKATSLLLVPCQSLHCTVNTRIPCSSVPGTSQVMHLFWSTHPNLVKLSLGDPVPRSQHVASARAACSHALTSYSICFHTFLHHLQWYRLCFSVPWASRILHLFWSTYPHVAFRSSQLGEALLGDHSVNNQLSVLATCKTDHW